MQLRRCYDVTLSRDEGNGSRYLVNASHHRPCWCIHRTSFLCLAGPVCAVAVAYCPLGKVLTYKNLIFSLNLQKFWRSEQYIQVQGDFS